MRIRHCKKFPIFVIHNKLEQKWQLLQNMFNNKKHIGNPFGLGSTSFGVTNKVAPQNCSFDLSGTDEYLDFGNILNSTIAGTGHTFSVQRTFKRKSLTGSNIAVFSKWNGLGNNRSLQIRIQSNDVIRVQTSRNGDASVDFNDSVEMLTNITDFVMLTVTFDYSVGDWSGIKIYLDDTLLTLANPTKAFLGAARVYSGTAEVLVGANKNGSGVAQQFADIVENETLVYSDVLTPTEISDRWNNGNITSPVSDSLVFQSDYTNSVWNGSEYDIPESVSSNDGVSVNVLENELLCVNI